MSTIQHHLVSGAGESVITVFSPDHAPAVAHSDHPNFRAISDTMLYGSDDEKASVFDLFDVGTTIENKFREALSDRISVKGDTIYLDHDPVESALSDAILRFLNEGVDVQPLVRFMERMEANPTEHSREQAWSWLNRRDFTVTTEGKVVMYKGVAAFDTGDGEMRYESITQGPAIVNGEEVLGAVPNNPGDVVEMARSQVQHNPAVGCAAGLHAGTWEYASNFAQGAVLEVHIAPEDIVSVPTDCSWQKLRASRYTVVRAIEVPYQSAYLDYDGPDVDEDVFEVDPNLLDLGSIDFRVNLNL